MTYTGFPANPYASVDFNVTSSTIKDDIGVHKIRVDISTANHPRFPLRIAVADGYLGGGKAFYGHDYRIRASSKKGGARRISPLLYEIDVPGGVTSFEMWLDVNQNNDPTEDIVLTIAPHPLFYNLGADLVHTVTCELAVEKPSAANTGYGATVLAGSGSLVLDGGDLVTAKDVDGVVRFAGPDNVVELSWVRGNGSDYGLYAYSAQVHPGQLIDRVKIGDDTVIPDETITTKSAAIFNVRGRAVACHITGCAADGIKPRGDFTLERSFIEKLYDDPANPKDAHCDGLQCHDGGANLVLLHNHFFLPWPGTPIAPVGAHFESNSCCFVDGQPYGSILAIGNWFVGGHWSFWLAQPQVVHGPVSLINNRFSVYNYGWQDPIDIDRCAEHCVVKDNPNTQLVVIGSKWDDGPLAGFPIDSINTHPVWSD